MMVLLYSIIVLGLMGTAAGLILAYASKRFAAWQDPNVNQIEEVLPGVNCGACGYAGCHAYAQAVASGKAPIDLCRPGANKVAAQIGEIMGQEAGEKEPKVAKRKCNGGNKEAKKKFDYGSIQTCKAASLVNNGYKQCSYSCLGFGDCALVCPVGAINMDENNLPQIDMEKCIACEKCVIECPRSILEMVPKKARVHVRCRSKDSAKNVVKACSVGCIACRKCEKECPFDAIHVIDNLAVIDYSKCTSCGKCVKVCPHSIIEQEPLPKKPGKKKKEGEEKNEEAD
ncbi:RnfABCDGE type electron transport complex subunit B [Candidatus Woesearchaeota archaeon]|nr:RnfABCDGE type electron transport complex subunit B [Candidatus Woesearchaeota archaeon]